MGFQEGGSGSAEILFHPRAPSGAALIMKRRKIGIGQLLAPGPQRGMCRKCSVQPLAISKLDDAPAAAAKDLVEALEHLIGADRVEALAVVVDDPPQVANVVLVAL